MKKIDLGQTIQIIANVGVIAGIVFLAMEIRESTRATQAEIIQTATSLDQEFLMQVGSDPELTRLWSTYFRAPDSLSEEERLQGQYLMTSTLRRLENVYLQYQMGAISEAGWESRQYLARNVASSAGFSDFIDGFTASSANQQFLEYLIGLRTSEN